MQIYLINLDRRPDRLEAMTRRATGLGLTLERVAALDAAQVEPATLDHWFMDHGPLGEIPRGDKACLLSHRLAWERFLATGDAHAVFLEDDVVLSEAARDLLANDAWIPSPVAVVKLEHYGPKGQRVLLNDFRSVAGDFQIGRMLSRHTGAAAYILSRGAAGLLVRQTRFALPVDHLLLPAIARQEQFVGARSPKDKSDIEGTRLDMRRLSWTYVKRELTRLAYDLRLAPRQLVALLGGAKFVAVKTAG
jgi:glycosyl transferase family 25